MPKGPRGEKRPADVIGAARGWSREPPRRVHDGFDCADPSVKVLQSGEVTAAVVYRPEN